jgi:hypothetical protein
MADYATSTHRAMASAEVLTLPSGDERGRGHPDCYVPVSDISGTLTTPDGVAGNLVLRLVSSDARSWRQSRGRLDGH